MAADEQRSTGIEAVQARQSNPKLLGPSRKGAPPGLCMDPLAATPDPAAAPLTIAFFGLGAVGSSMLICLSELADRDDVEVHVYPEADHGFANRDRLEFHGASAQLADERSIAFLERNLRT